MTMPAVHGADPELSDRLADYSAVAGERDDCLASVIAALDAAEAGTVAQLATGNRAARRRAKRAARQFEALRGRMKREAARRFQMATAGRAPEDFAALASEAQRKLADILA